MYMFRYTPIFICIYIYIYIDFYGLGSRAAANGCHTFMLWATQYNPLFLSQMCAIYDPAYHPAKRTQRYKQKRERETQPRDTQASNGATTHGP